MNPLTQTPQSSPIGPFTVESFKEDYWKQIQGELSTLDKIKKNYISHKCQHFLQLLTELSHCADYNQYFGTPSIKTFFNNRFLSKCIDTLLGYKHLDDQVVIEFIRKCLQQIAILWSWSLKNNFWEFSQVADMVLDLTRDYYNISAISAIQSDMLKSSSEQSIWLETLKKGDIVDCLNMEPVCKQVFWSQARIAEVTDSILKIRFLYDDTTISRDLDKTIETHEIAPHMTKCNVVDLEWRLNLKQDDEVAICNTLCIKGNGIVLDTRNTLLEDGESFKEVLISYRRYCKKGEQTDAQGKSYTNWAFEDDIWISATNPRISRKSTTMQAESRQEIMIDDTNDMVYESRQKKIYAVTRLGYCSSPSFIDIINMFGETGGFEAMLERIIDKTNAISLQRLGFICSLISNISPMFHRDFVHNYFSRLEDAVWKALQQNYALYMKDYHRVMMTIDYLKSMLPRIYQLEISRKKIGELCLQLCLDSINSDINDVQIKGYYMLLDITVKADQEFTSAYIDKNSLDIFLTENSLFEKFYTNKPNATLIGVSKGLFIYILKRGLITIEQLQSLLDGTKESAESTKSAIYELLFSCYYYLNESQAERMNKLILNRFSEQNQDEHKIKYKDVLLEKLLAVSKKEALKKAVSEDLGENTQITVPILVKKLIRLIMNTPVASESPDTFSREEFISYLCREKNFFNLISKDIKMLRSQYLKSAISPELLAGQPDKSFLSTDVLYLEEIGKRCELIFWTFDNNTSKYAILNYEQLVNLWDALFVSALVNEERILCLELFKQITTLWGGFSIDIQDLAKFFSENINFEVFQSYQISLKEGFKMFNKFFIYVNQKLWKISEPVHVIPVGPFRWSSCLRDSDYIFKDLKPTTFMDYIVHVLPDQLEGIGNLWKFSIEPQDENTANEAMLQLMKLYLYPSQKMECHLTEIREAFLANFYKIYIDTLRHSSGGDLESKYLRWLRLITYAIDDSEKDGFGDLQSHFELLKGEVLSFTVTFGTSIKKDAIANLSLNSNATVYRLRIEVAKLFKLHWNQVELTSTFIGKIKPSDNNKTLYQIGLENGETLLIGNSQEKIACVNFLHDSNTLNEKVSKALCEIFDQYADNGVMTSEQFATLFNSAAIRHEQLLPNNWEITNIYRDFNNGKNCQITEDDFLRHCCKKANQSEASQISLILDAHSYRPDLKKITKLGEVFVDITALPRYIISKNKDYFHMLFSLLEQGDKIADLAWELICKLPTNPEKLTSILALRNILEVSNPTMEAWATLLGAESKYKLLYSLIIVGCLICDENYYGNKLVLDSKNAELIEAKKSWKEDFINLGGAEYLVNLNKELAEDEQVDFVKKTTKNLVSKIVEKASFKKNL